MRLYQRTKLSTLPIVQIGMSCSVESFVTIKKEVKQAQHSRYAPVLSLCFLSTLLAACLQKPLPVAENNSHVNWSKRNQSLQAINQWTVKGKTAFQTDKASGSATFEWKQQRNEFTFAAFNPLGNEAFRLQGNSAHVTLFTTDGKQYEATNSETLFSRTVGFQFPFSSLIYWVRGLPNPAQPAITQFDGSHRLAQLKQANWIVEFQNYTTVDGLDLPRFIIMSSPPYKAKVMIYSWKT